MRSLLAQVSRIEKKHQADMESREAARTVLLEAWEGGPETWEMFVETLAEVFAKHGVSLSAERLEFYRAHSPKAQSLTDGEG